MDAFPLDDFFEWLHFWGWTVFTILLLAVIGVAVWVVFGS